MPGPLITVGVWPQPAVRTAAKQANPSEHTASELHLAPAGDLLRAEAFDAVQAHLLRMSRLIDLHRRHEWRLAACAAPALVTAPPPAPVGVVELHQAAELARGLAFQHRLHELVLQEPSAILGDPELARERERGNAVLGLGDQVHGQEPHRQWQLRAREHRPCRHRALPRAGVPLEQTPASQSAVAAVPALGGRRTPAASARAPARMHCSGVPYRTMNSCKLVPS